MKQQRIAIILHNPTGSAGTISQILQQRGYQLERFCPLDGDPLPNPDHYHAAIVMGGKMSANDKEKLPELLQEILWIQSFIKSKKPFLGICLGAQLLAMVLGANITRHPKRIVEIGYYPIYPTLEGHNSIFKNAPSRFFQWHNEGFSLPANTVKLAESDLYPNQAFRYQQHAYGFQFHPEATREQIDHWHQRDPEELTHPGAQTINAQLNYCADLSFEIRTWLEEFLTQWLNPNYD